MLSSKGFSIQRLFRSWDPIVADLQDKERESYSSKMTTSEKLYLQWNCGEHSTTEKWNIWQIIQKTEKVKREGILKTGTYYSFYCGKKWESFSIKYYRASNSL